MLTTWFPQWLARRNLNNAYRDGEINLSLINTAWSTFVQPVLTSLSQQIKRGWWEDQALLNHVNDVQKRMTLWQKDVGAYRRAHNDHFDLPLELPSLWQAEQTPALGDVEMLRSFFSTASDDKRSAVWTSCVLDEAELAATSGYTNALINDLQRTWNPVLDGLKAEIANEPEESYLALLDLLYRQGSLQMFLDTFAVFRQSHPNGANHAFPWLADPSTFNTAQVAPFLAQYERLLRQLITVLELRHRQNEPDLATLYEIRRLFERAAIGEEVPAPEPKRGVPMPAATVPTPNILRFKMPPTAKLTQLQATLSTMTAGFAPTAERQITVLRFWQAFCARQLFDCANAQTFMPKTANEALGLLQTTLASELQYFNGDYETAQHGFMLVANQAQTMLDRLQLDEAQRQNGRSFIGLVNQWRGNALFALNDFAAANDAYLTIGDLLAPDDAEGQLLLAINQGNLAFLQNNLADYRGYISYDKKEQALLSDKNPPEDFLRLKYDRHRAALDQASQQYATAITLLPKVTDLLERKRYAALLYANQAAIAWMQANLITEASYFSPALAESLANLGTQQTLLQIAIQGFTKAKTEAVFDKAMQINAQASISELHERLDKHDEAIKQANEALKLLNLDPTGDMAAQLQTTPSPDMVWRVMLTLARAYEGKQQFEQATTFYNHAIRVVERLRDQVKNPDWQAASVQDKFQVYENALHCAFATNNYPQMFDLAEQLRSQSFLDVLEAARLNLDQFLSPELKTKRAMLAADITARNAAIKLAASNPDQSQLEPLLAAQRQAQTNWTLLQSEIALDLADEAQQLNPTPQSWAQFQPYLAQHPDTIVLSFVVGSEWSYLLVADGAGLQAYQLPNRATLEYHVARLLWYVQRGITRWREFVAANLQVVQHLFGESFAAGLREKLQNKRVVILPDGILYYLPFQLLLVQSPPFDPATYGKTPRLADPQVCAELLPHYFLNHASLSVAQSASVWRMLQDQAAGQPDALALGVYNVNYQTNVPPINPAYAKAAELLIQYGDLSQTRVIANVLKAMEAEQTTILALSAWNDDKTPWDKDKQSNEANFKRLLEQHRIRYVLFAGHGVFNDKYPHFSGMIFNMASPDGSPSDNDQDGFFGINDVFNIKMPDTELIFLAACQGGLGLISRGEGVNALTRALMYHGSPTVIASLWSVDVLATMDLVQAFFAQIHTNPSMDKADAMRVAQQTVASDKSKPHFAYPFYWSPFVVMGKR